MQDNDRIREKTKGNVFFEHKYTRRKRNHDYTGPCTYHIILKKHKDCRDFGIVGAIRKSDIRSMAARGSTGASWAG